MHPSPASKPIITPRSPGAIVLNRPRRDGSLVILVLGAIRAYKTLISPLFTGCCRFYPSCADYMAEAVATHGAVKGTWLGMCRLIRCHPLGAHGVDPVPPVSKHHVGVQRP